MGLDIYLDNAATTRVFHDNVLNVMNKTHTQLYGNCSCGHVIGIQSSIELKKCETIFLDFFTHNVLNTDYNVIFTSGATESNNTVIHSYVKQCKNKPTIITTFLEHPSVKETINSIRKTIPINVRYISVTKNGQINLSHLKEEICKYNKPLVICMHVNNETGIIQPIDKVKNICSENDATLMVDATQALVHFRGSYDYNGIDYITSSSHKINGPKGVGSMLVKGDIEPLIYGGGQQSGFRSGTENLPGIMGYTEAIINLMNSKNVTENLYNLKSKYKVELKKIFLEHNYKIVFNECLCSDNDLENSSHILNFSIYDPKDPISGLNNKYRWYMSENNVCFSTGSACSDGKATESYVIKCMTDDINRYSNTVRLSFSTENTDSELDTFLKLTKKYLRGD
jgi:cysteine desulfurase